MVGMVAHCCLLLSMLLPMVCQLLPLLMVGRKPLRQSCSGSKAAHFEHREKQVALAVVDPRVVQLVDKVLHRDIAGVESMHELVGLRSRQKLRVQGHASQVLHLIRGNMFEFERKIEVRLQYQGWRQS